METPTAICFWSIPNSICLIISIASASMLAKLNRGLARPSIAYQQEIEFKYLARRLYTTFSRIFNNN